MKTFGAVLLIAMLGGGIAVHAQVSNDAHPAAGAAHPAKADPHPAAPAVAHPANPGYVPESNSTSTLGDVSAPQPFTTTSIDTASAVTVSNAPETFVVPKFVDTQTNAVAVPATTATAAPTNQSATTTP